ncbi:hypothetical protein CYA_2860 [Synechococcus sp. JA-3-3Ab]|nr:hypothetical protein CYA_2860 [Synechococcus sp. JA-3-3Ab]
MYPPILMGVSRKFLSPLCGRHRQAVFIPSVFLMYFECLLNVLSEIEDWTKAASDGELSGSG